MNLSSDFQSLLLIAALVVSVVVIIGGISNKIVIFYDTKDLMTCFAMIAIPLVGFGLSDSKPFESDSWNYMYSICMDGTSVLVSSVCVWLNLRSAIEHNRSVLIGLVVGAVKSVYAIFALLILWAKFSTITNKSSTGRDVALAAVVIGLLAWLSSVLVNGERVYMAKGWRLDGEDDSKRLSDVGE